MNLKTWIIKQRYSLLAVLAVVILVVYCFRATNEIQQARDWNKTPRSNDDSSRRWDAEPSTKTNAVWTDDPARPDERTLTIKGLSMGMDKVNARSVLNKLGFQTVRTDFAPRNVGIFSTNATADRVSTNWGNLVLVYDAEEKLTHVEIWGGMANWLFNVADMNVKEFAQTLVNEYHLGNMEPFSRGNIAGWKYRDGNSGVELVVYTGSSGDKKITFHSIPNSKERKFD